MKGLGVYYHCAKAGLVTLLGPRAMGPSPPQARGYFCAIKLCGAPRGPKKPYFFDKIDKNNDNNQVWAGLFDLKYTFKNYLTSIHACLLNIYICFYIKKMPVGACLSYK